MQTGWIWSLRTSWLMNPDCYRLFSFDYLLVFFFTHTVQTKMRRPQKNESPVALRQYAIVCVVLLLDEVGCIATVHCPWPACVHCRSPAVLIWTLEMISFERINCHVIPAVCQYWCPVCVVQWRLKAAIIPCVELSLCACCFLLPLSTVENEESGFRDSTCFVSGT